ncbi:hypothetical protein ZIOFF_070925 [Zingiber officinale]|uniref:Homeobox domain-containing protein n=2 Tax=Zingiber officinale TaxID=94328 RepID=A0A8J5CUF1_ZINOF|nr:hypothetical protein ZIOFF_070925 [Zingiber officinale]
MTDLSSSSPVSVHQFMEGEEECDTRLALGIGTRINPTATLHFDALFPVQLKEEDDEEEVAVSTGKAGSNCSSERKKKKLKLTREQVLLLEESFGERSTLDSEQKQDLAERLCIRPRQVEVWFQNRRARTKTRQMEAEHEHLKRRCERLDEENRRLKKELVQLVKATAMTASSVLCPSCERAAGAGIRHRRT